MIILVYKRHFISKASRHTTHMFLPNIKNLASVPSKVGSFKFKQFNLLAKARFSSAKASMCVSENGSTICINIMDTMVTDTTTTAGTVRNTGLSKINFTAWDKYSQFNMSSFKLISHTSRSDSVHAEPCLLCPINSYGI